MSTLYLITGPAGVGKSTISNALSAKLQKSALIEGDTIYNQVVGSYVSPWKEGNHLDLFWKISIMNIKFYLDSGYDVVFNYILDKNSLKEVLANINCEKIKFVVLMTNEETLLKRDAERPEDCQMKERCLVLLNSFRQKNFDEKYVLDTTKLSINEIAETIKEQDRFVVKGD